MARLHFVKSARKDNPVAKKGESYYWWQNYKSPKRFSKEKPKRHQMTNSAFKQSLYQIQDCWLEMFGHLDKDSPETIIGEIVDYLQEMCDNCQESLDNMPEGLQEGDTGQLLQQRIDSLDDAISNIDSLDVEFESDAKKGTDEYNQELEDWIENLESEIDSYLSDIEEG